MKKQRNNFGAQATKSVKMIPEDTFDYLSFLNANYLLTRKCGFTAVASGTADVRSGTKTVIFLFRFRVAFSKKISSLLILEKNKIQFNPLLKCIR